MHMHTSLMLAGVQGGARVNRRRPGGGFGGADGRERSEASGAAARSSPRTFREVSRRRSTARRGRRRRRRTRLRYRRDVAERWPRDGRDMREMWPRSTRDLPEICPRSARDLIRGLLRCVEMGEIASRSDPRYGPALNRRALLRRWACGTQRRNRVRRGRRRRISSNLGDARRIGGVGAEEVCGGGGCVG